ncbi:MAG: site-2 protease family protein [Candidatus Sumerlaeia bacterium]|nr:site-2 protease family protein [Candidatus Sumerlaeia bacterium]
MGERSYDFILMIPVLLLSIVVHEIAHAYAAKLAGDMTATRLKRLSFNPLYHIDIFGTIILPFILYITNSPLIGWAKPVPVDPRQFRRPYWELIVSLAGPFSNFTLAVISAFLLTILFPYLQTSDFQLPLLFLKYFVLLNLVLWLFNLLPIPPLDGSHILRYFMLRISPESDKFFFIFDRIGFIVLYLLIISPLRDYFFKLVEFSLNVLFLIF